MNTFEAYACGFWEGEGWAVISVERGKEGRSDIHHCGMYVTQRARCRIVLDRFQEAFGGTVTVRDTKIRGSENWAEQADWHIHTREQIERFCRAIQPHCLIKAAQVAIMLEYVTGFVPAANLRDDLGRVQGRALSPEEVARRERLRLALHAVNGRGSTRTVQIVQPARIAPSKPIKPANTATVPRGEKRWNSVLTEDAVRSMRAEYAAGGVTMGELAIRYGVTGPAVRMAIRRESWRHVT